MYAHFAPSNNLETLAKQAEHKGMTTTAETLKKANNRFKTARTLVTRHELNSLLFSCKEVRKFL